ncbi:LytR/AlgR family response regulator transcription factor [Sphingobacterium spiritivorum]|uniref:LytR/AlgR family response regulator transcription factor n=1 Tax=Sphingobacterium spiritivorum TaxID=258 RepID=UPI003DA267D2
MLKCILLDDELPGLKFLKLITEQMEELEIVRTYNDPAKLLQEAGEMQFDLCIMDIEMPVINGLQIAKQLPDKMIIFVTAYSEYAADAFDLNVVDYVRKPLSKERLQVAIDKAVARKPREKELAPINFNTDHGKYLLHLQEITHILNSKIDGRDKDVFLRNGESICIKNVNFAKLEELLPEKNFCRINKKEIIALDIVRSYTHNTISSIPLNSGISLTFQLSNTYRQTFLSKIRD